MNKMKRIIKANWGLTILFFVLVIRFLFVLWPSTHESLYFSHIFPGIREIQSWFNPIWIVPGYFLIFILSAGLIGFLFFRRRSWKLFFRNIFNFLGFALSLFMICFGFQYVGEDLATRMNLPPPPDKVDITDLYFLSMENALISRATIKSIDTASDITKLNHIPNNDSIYLDVIDCLKAYEYKACEFPVVIQEIPFGILRKLGISGIYNPFTGECNVEKELPTLLKTNVIAHEMAHACGITNEGEANFIAWLALKQSSDPYLNYTADYALWRQIAKHINRKLSKDELSKISTLIPEQLLQDRLAIIEILRKDAPIYPELTEKFNDTYLKIQGIETGVEDYDNFLTIYLSWNLALNPER